MKKLTLTLVDRLQHSGICDASAAMPMAGKNQFVVANDEDNFLRVYQSDSSGAGTILVDLGQYLKEPTQKEIDIEGSAIIDNIVYWITSHARNSQGELKPKRRNFLAVQFTITKSGISVSQVGHSYGNLLDDMLKDNRFKKHLESAEPLAPEAEGGLNIEGLGATPDRELYIGFRNPIPEGKALIIPLKNPANLTKKEGVSAIFGDPILLNLEKRGIRSIEYWQAKKIYLIIAGSHNDTSNFALYQWSGNKDKNPQLVDFTFPQDFRPEALFFYPKRPEEFQIMSDDGSAKRDGVTECKKLQNNDDKFFGSIRVKANFET